MVVGASGSGPVPRNPTQGTGPPNYAHVQVVTASEDGVRGAAFVVRPPAEGAGCIAEVVFRVRRAPGQEAQRSVSGSVPW
jgi:hypothetical protein